MWPALPSGELLVGMLRSLPGCRAALSPGGSPELRHVWPHCLKSVWDEWVGLPLTSRPKVQEKRGPLTL